MINAVVPGIHAAVCEQAMHVFGATTLCSLGPDTPSTDG
jgi:hypothetical protein